MRFGKQGEKGIRLNGLRPEVVRVADVGEENLLVHDERASKLPYRGRCNLLKLLHTWPVFFTLRDVEQDYTITLAAAAGTAGGYLCDKHEKSRGN